MKRVSLFLLPLILWSLPLSLKAECFQANAADSEIRFAFNIERSRFTGHFRQFELTYCWQDKPEDGHIEVLVDMTSARTGNSDLDIGMQEREGLNIDQFPVARWQTDSIEKQGERYQAEGTLTIRGISHKESGFFHLTREQGGWVVSGESMLKRLDYDIGSGEYADTDFIPDPVEIHYEFRLKSRDQTLQME